MKPFFLENNRFEKMMSQMMQRTIPRVQTTLRGFATSGGGGGAATGRKLKILGISGSLRKASCNSGMLRAAATQMPADVEFTIADINLPLYNGDLDVPGKVPESVVRFKKALKEADAVLIATAEYNYSMTAPLKNAVDWGSRAPNDWAKKSIAMMAAGGGLGGGRATYHFRQSGVYIDASIINHPEVFVRIFDQPSPFDKNGNLTDTTVVPKIKAVVDALLAHHRDRASCTSKL